MDPTSIIAEAVPISESNFMLDSNRHLYDWLIEGETRTQQINELMNDVDRQYASQQPRVDRRNIEKEQIYDSVERLFQSRSLVIEMGGGFKEDYLSNETDPSIKLSSN